MLEETRTRFSQRHPLIFGVMMIVMAIVLILGAMAFFRSMGWTDGNFSLGRDKLGVVHIEGTIMDSTDVVDWIRTLRDDDSVSGVLLRVNSPGGAIAPSQEIYQPSPTSRAASRLSPPTRPSQPAAATTRRLRPTSSWPTPAPSPLPSVSWPNSSQ